MAADYKTMKWVETLSEDDDDADRIQVSECEVCHGFSLDWCEDPGELTCVLCDEGAPLEEKYRMALNTLGWLSTVHAPPIGYVYFRSPSFKRVVYDAEDGESTWVLFEYEHAIVQADLGGFDIMVGGEKRRRWLGRGLDADGGRFSPRILALEVVNRVRHDLELEYGENAGSETRALQNASRESR